MSLMGPDKLDKLKKIAREDWAFYVSKWEKSSSLMLYTEVRELLTRIICEWAGVPLNEWEVHQRAADLIKMVDSFGGLGVRHQSGKKARQRTESWLRDLIQQTRDGLLTPPPETGLHVFALSRDANGDLIDLNVAAVDLLNVLRPTIAITYYILFSALALREFPTIRDRLNDENQHPDYLEWTVHEVRRYYPFVPFLGARVKADFEWNNYTFKSGQLVILDVYGINHDPRIWNDPSNFRPERFKDWNGSPYNFIPQGGGDHHKDHRCAGEWVTIELMKIALEYLGRKMDYQVLDQDLKYDLSRMPTFPASGFIIRDVKLKSEKPIAKSSTKSKTVKEKNES